MPMDWSTHPHQRGTPSQDGDAQARFLGSMGASSLRIQNADGSESVKVNGRLYVNPAPEEGMTVISRLCWLPEGIVITPRTAANQLGWGLPPTADGIGTVGGDFPFVVLNRYQNNNLPSYLHSVYSGKQSTGVNFQMNLAWPINYINLDLGEKTARFGLHPPDDAGAFINGKFLPQFIARYVPLLTEARQANWYCHRPVIRPFPTQEAQDIFDGINNVRLANGLPVLSAPVDGWTTDLAQVVVFENVKAGEQAHESSQFSRGWQTIVQRFRGRDSQSVDSFGENLYGGASRANIATETIKGWVNSPPHFEVMTRDYTDGRRPGYIAAGQGQLMAEVGSIGYWRTATFDDTFGKRRGRETSAVIRSLSPRSHRATTYENPVIGKVSINASPSLLNMLGTRNFSWSEKYVFSFKHTDIIAVANEPDSFSTHRQMLVGAGMCIKHGQRRMTDEEFNTLLLKKRQHDVRYNARLVSKGKPVDTAIVGAENGLTPEMTSWELEARCLVYEEVGQPYKAPDGSATTCYLVLRSGQAEDYLTTVSELARYALPFNPATISATALFSEDGSRCAYAVGELTTDGDTWHGEKLHFYEADENGITEIATAEVPITYTSPYPDEGEFRHAIDTQCHLMPYYSGNTLHWVDVKVNSVGWRNNSAGTTRRDLYASLVFDGREWPYVETNSGGEYGSSDTSVSGTVKHILTFDPKYPERAHWVEFTITNSTSTKSKVSASVMRNMANPVMVKELYQNVEVDCGSMDYVWLVPMYANKSAATPAGTKQHLHPTQPWAHEPLSNYFASFTLGGASLSNPAGTSYVLGAAGRPQSTPIAPVSFSRTAGHSDSISEGCVSDGFVMGGLLHSQPFGIGTAGRPIGDEVHIKSSNLDLEAITGITDLSDNILPIWSL